MVDYSKWDKMDVSDSSDSEGEPTPRPKVTKFDTEQKVTFGGNRDHEVTIAPGTSPGNTPEQQGTSPAPNQTTTASSEGPQTSSSALSRETVLAQWTRNGGTVFSQQLRATSSEARPFPTYHWAQTRDSVTIRFELGAAGQAPEDAADADEDAADAEVSGAALRRDWTGKDVRIGVSTKMVGNRLRSVVSIKDLFDGEVVLQYEVEAPEQAEDIDWEFEYLPSGGAADSRTAQDLGSGGENRGKKHMRLTLRKASVIAKATLWWRCVFLGHPEIECDAMVDRSAQNVEKQQKFYEAMKEAEALFKEKVRQNPRAESSGEGVGRAGSGE